MTDKIQKIREEVERLQKRAEHNFDISLTENERQFWLGESNVLTLIGKPIDTLQEESVSEELEEAALRANMIKKDIPKEYLHEYPYNEYGRRKFIEGAQWQKQQIMKETVLCGSDGWFINNKRNCRKNGRFHKYYVSTITHDKPLPMENGKDYRLIVIKED